VATECVVTAESPNHDAILDAKAAHLHYVRGSTAGIRRHRAGKGFRYADSNGKTLTDPATIITGQRGPRLAVRGDGPGRHVESPGAEGQTPRAS
jgi:hypothetical protein